MVAAARVAPGVACTPMCCLAMFGSSGILATPVGADENTKGRMQPALGPAPTASRRSRSPLHDDHPDGGARMVGTLQRGSRSTSLCVRLLAWPAAVPPVT